MVKKIFAVLFCLFLTGVVWSADQNRTVYIATSGNGKRYHLEHCRTLKNGKAAITVANAKSRGYTPCKVCNPGD
jgi:hypothetical protein